MLHKFNVWIFIGLISLNPLANANDSLKTLSLELFSVWKADRSKAEKIIHEIGNIQSPEAVDFLLGIASFPPPTDPQDTQRKGIECFPVVKALDQVKSEIIINEILNRERLSSKQPRKNLEIYSYLLKKELGDARVREILTDRVNREDNDVQKANIEFMLHFLKYEKDSK